MSVGEVLGYAGAGLAGVAYLPQITHMVRERCVAGISRPAFTTWFLASALILASALASHTTVFVVLGALQTGATGFISGYVTLHAGCCCDRHR